MKHHRFASLVALIAAVALGLGLWLPQAMSQGNMKQIKAEAFKTHSRPAAVFVHDAHNDKASLDDCVVCHHGKDANGKLDKEEESMGTPCADCHAVAQSPGTPLMRAYHQQCIVCHREKQKGPTHCGGCHKL